MARRDIDRLYDGYIVSCGRVHKEYRTLTAAENAIKRHGYVETGTFVHEWPDGMWLQLVCTEDDGEEY